VHQSPIFATVLLNVNLHVLLIQLVLCLFDFSFVNLVLDTFLRFSFVCYPLLLCLFFLLVLFAYSIEFVIQSFT